MDADGSTRVFPRCPRLLCRDHVASGQEPAAPQAVSAAVLQTAGAALLAIGVPASDSARALIALAVATLALRNTPLAFTLFETNPGKEGIALLAEGFDMLEEDLEKERFFALARKT